MYNWLTQGINSVHDAALQELCCIAPFLFLYETQATDRAVNQCGDHP
jgi:hypothetical protein